MKSFLTIIFSIYISAQATAQEDLIIFRDGSEKSVKVIQVADKRITYKSSEKKNAQEMYADPRDIYMIHFKERGNVYITPEGKRVTGENQKTDKDADIIYLVDGKEIQAYNLQVLENIITYQEEKPKKKHYSPLKTSNKDEVFMIKYKDGTKDMMTDISNGRHGTEEKEHEDIVPEKQTKENEMQVIFHNVKKNETLAIISKRYNLKMADIIEWNDLPQNIKPNTRLQTGMQLMLYVKPETDGGK